MWVDTLNQIFFCLKGIIECLLEKSPINKVEIDDLLNKHKFRTHINKTYNQL